MNTLRYSVGIGSIELRVIAAEDEAKAYEDEAVRRWKNGERGGPKELGVGWVEHRSRRMKQRCRSVG